MARDSGRIYKFVEIGHRVDGLIRAWVLTCNRMPHRAARRLAFQDDPGSAAPFEIVSDLHATALRAAVFDAKLDLCMSLIASDGDAAYIHVHCAYIERAHGSQVLQDSRANGVAIVRLLFAGAQSKEHSN